MCIDADLPNSEQSVEECDLPAGRQAQQAMPLHIQLGS